ncbi:hypothetical protein C8R46DRAFT_1059174 [Mycena filopes]|nr:hypothetical protein C8R46DRAFT_1059174 [Mycena filopes]
MAELPVELFQAIAKDVGDDPSIFNLRLVSKTLNSVATPVAFRVVVVCDAVKSATAVSFLQKCDESITSLVREVIFKGDSANQKPRRWANETSGEAGREAVRAVFAGLAKFPKLEHLRCYFHDCYQEESSDFMPENPTHFLLLQLGIFPTLAAHPHPPLASLTLTNVLAIPDPIYAQQDFQRVFRPLQRLDISILSDVDFEGSYFQEPLVEFWEQSVPSMLRSASAITSLTLRSDQPTGSCPRLPFTDISLPHLTSLTLHNFCLVPSFPESDVVVAFILQHKSTLAHLELHHCSIDGDEDGDFPRPWFAVLALFEAELGSLSEFVFENDPQFEYTRLDAGWGYMPWEEEIAGQEQDLPALERLMAVVNSRRAGS